MMKNSSLKAPIQLLAIKAQELALLEQKVTQVKAQLKAEEETLQTLSQYIDDYSNINDASWPNQDTDSALQRLKNGSRFISNLQLALIQQRSKVSRCAGVYEKLLAEWRLKSQTKQKLNELIVERKAAIRHSAELRDDQLQNDDWVANR